VCKRLRRDISASWASCCAYPESSEDEAQREFRICVGARGAELGEYTCAYSLSTRGIKKVITKDIPQ
jgi:hypothetical protein